MKTLREVVMSDLAHTFLEDELVPIGVDEPDEPGDMYSCDSVCAAFNAGFDEGGRCQVAHQDGLQVALLARLFRSSTEYERALAVHKYITCRGALK